MGNDTKRGRGRPPVEDRRKPRGGFSDAEWAHCVSEAKKAGAKSTASWVRERCGL